jgi:23S rRNA pseudouridine2605 synthase
MSRESKRPRISSSKRDSSDSRSKKSFSSSDKPKRSFKKDDSGFQKRDGYSSEKRRFEKRDDNFSGKRSFEKSESGERKPYKRDGERDGYKSRRDDGERKPYKRDGERDGYKSRRDDGERKPYKRDGERDGYISRRDDGERKPYKRDGERDGYKSRRDDGERKPYKRDGERDGYKSRRDDGERKPYKRDGERDGYKSRKDDGERKSFVKRADGKYESAGRSERSSFDREEKRNYSKKRDFDKPRKNYDDDSYKKTYKSKSYKPEKEEKPKKQGPKRTSDQPNVSNDAVRLNRYMANAGICSRREADVLIATGVVTVNGKIVTEMGYKVNPTDVITYGGVPIKNETKKYLLLNKPKDYITTMDDPESRKTVMDLIRKACKERLYPVGRLDRNTTGVLLFTNDGDMTAKLTHPKFEVRKVYHVTLDKKMTSEDYKMLNEGVELSDGFIKPDAAEFVGSGKSELGVEIHSGKNRIVRRMFEHLGYEVTKLDRVAFAGLTKKDLPKGKFRFLTEKEISFLKMLG